MSALRYPLLWLFVPLLLVGLSLQAARGEEAPEQVDQARVLFQFGAAAFSKGQYREAIRAFEEAQKLAPRPGLLFSLAQAQRLQYAVDAQPATLEAALSNYRKYLGEVAQGGRRTEAAEAVAELESVLARLREQVGPPEPIRPSVDQTQGQLMISSAAPQAELWVDGVRLGELPLSHEIQPGKHRLKVTAPGHLTTEREILVAAGAVVALDLPLRRQPARLNVQVKAPAQVFLGGRLLGPSPLSTEVAAGFYRIAVVENGHRPLVRDLTLEAGGEQLIEGTLPSSGQRLVSYLLASTAAVSATGGGMLAMLALAEQGRAQDILHEREERSITTDQLAAYHQALDRRDRLRLGAMITFSAAVLFGLASSLAYLFDEPSLPDLATPAQETPAPAAPTPATPTPGRKLELSGGWLSSSEGWAWGVLGRF